MSEMSNEKKETVIIEKAQRIYNGGGESEVK